VLRITHDQRELAGVAPLLGAGSPPGRRCVAGARGLAGGLASWASAAWTHGDQAGRGAGGTGSGVHKLGVQARRRAYARCAAGRGRS
jgi:hypothetical protein